MIGEYKTRCKFVCVCVFLFFFSVLKTEKMDTRRLQETERNNIIPTDIIFIMYNIIHYIYIKVCVCRFGRVKITMKKKKKVYIYIIYVFEKNIYTLLLRFDLLINCVCSRFRTKYRFEYRSVFFFVCVFCLRY